MKAALIRATLETLLAVLCIVFTLKNVVTGDWVPAIWFLVAADMLQRAGDRSIEAARKQAWPHEAYISRAPKEPVASEGDET